MDVLDQLGAVREGKLSRRRFTKGLLAAGVAMTTMPINSRRAMAQTGEQATYFTWGGYDIPELFGEYEAKNGELPNFAIFGGSEEALTKMRGGFVVDVSHPCNQSMPRWVQTGLFQPIDTSRVSHWGDVIPELVDLPGNDAEAGKVWMAPFDWGARRAGTCSGTRAIPGGWGRWPRAGMPGGAARSRRGWISQISTRPKRLTRSPP
jgi:spermidine/putrescine transport system substrate-binding protein